MTVDAHDSVPLWLLYDDEIEAWRAARSPIVKSWLTEQGFKGEKHRVLLLPDARGALDMAVGGLGKRGPLSLWHAAGFVERLPPRRFHLAQTWPDAAATQLCLGLAYGGYRFDRYRPGKSERVASFEPPPNADRRFVANAVESLNLARDMINTPANDMGPAELAAAARQLADRPHAEYREWAGEELRLPRHSRRGASEQLGAAAR
jgi:leucyl aminopeptidase